MNENKARYISLIVIALEAVLAFFLYGMVFWEMHLPELAIQGNKPPVGMIAFLLIFLVIGILIILSVFFKIPFYIFTVFEIMTMAFYTVIYTFNVGAILPCLIVLAPHIFYYIVRIKSSSKT